MRIHELCGNCKHFEHDCMDGNGCFETCEHPNKEIADNFTETYDEEKITSCKGYEKYGI